MPFTVMTMNDKTKLLTISNYFNGSHWFNPEFDQFPGRLRNLHGKTVAVTTFQMEPFIFIDKEDEGLRAKYSGVEVNIITAIASLMNFRLQ